MNDAGQVNDDRMLAQRDQLPMDQRSQVYDLMGAQEELVPSFTETQSSASINSYFEKHLRGVSAIT